MTRPGWVLGHPGFASTGAGPISQAQAIRTREELMIASSNLRLAA